MQGVIVDLEQRGLLPTAVFGDSIESWVSAMFSATHFSPRYDSLLLDSAEDCEMAVKLMAMYPRPKDIEAFERLYNREHAPMTEDILPGKTMIVATKVLVHREERHPSTASWRFISPRWWLSKLVRLRKAALRSRQVARQQC